MQTASSNRDLAARSLGLKGRLQNEEPRKRLSSCTHPEKKSVWLKSPAPGRDSCALLDEGRLQGNSEKELGGRRVRIEFDVRLIWQKRKAVIRLRHTKAKKKKVLANENRESETQCNTSYEKRKNGSGRGSRHGSKRPKRNTQRRPVPPGSRHVCKYGTILLSPREKG